MRRIVPCLALLLAVAMPRAYGATTPAGPHAFKLVANRSTTFTWRLSSPARLDNSNWFLSPPEGLDHRSGAIAALLVRRGTVDYVGLLDDRALGKIWFGATNATLPAGDYQVTVITDGRASFRIPMGGLTADVNVVGRHARTPKWSRRVTDQAPPALPTAGIAEASFAMKQRSAVIVGMTVNASDPQAMNFHFCVAQQPHPCVTDPNAEGTGVTGSTSATPASTGDAEYVAWAAYLPGFHPQGTYYAEGESAAVATRAETHLVVVDIS